MVKTNKKKKIVVAVSGGFDPIHIGHARLFKEAKAMGDELVVILNNDNWLMKKKGFVFIPQKERREIIKSLKWVGRVIPTRHGKNPEDMSVCRELKELKPDVFANGGDRFKNNVPEVGACREIGCKMFFNVGWGGKIQSSSQLLERFLSNNKVKNKIGILGYGEVGQAIARFYKNPKIKDLSRDDGLSGAEVLNVCIPWSENFIETVKKEIKKIKPKLTIIHSTVVPGATKKIGGMIVHSPIRGIHPKLFEGIKTFVKYMGADNKKAGRLAKKHLEGLGLKTKLFFPSLTTELGKILDTTYYGLCIAWHGEMKKICDKFGVNFEEAVTDFNKTYNEGYAKLGKSNVVRPVLHP